VVVTSDGHGRRKGFFLRSANSESSKVAKKNSAGGTKVVKFHFAHSETKKQPFLR